MSRSQYIYNLASPEISVEAMVAWRTSQQHPERTRIDLLFHTAMSTSNRYIGTATNLEKFLIPKSFKHQLESKRI